MVTHEGGGKVRHLSKINVFLSPLLAIAFALFIGAILMEISGFNSIEAYAEMWHGVFGSRRNFAEVLLKATPLILIGSGLAISFRCGVWNIGAEGQFYMGGIHRPMLRYKWMVYLLGFLFP